MATKLKQLSKWLSDEGIPNKVKKKKGIILAVDHDEDDISTVHMIKLHKEDTLIQWFMKIIDNSDDDIDLDKHINLKNSSHKNLVLEYILSLNHQYKLGSWEYDYHDGDLRFYMGFPLEDTEITEAQFNRILHVMFYSGRHGAKGIKHILEHGELPSDEENIMEFFKLLEQYIEKKEKVIDTEVIE